MQGSSGCPGLPVSVLVGHAGPAAFVDFHPTHPDALLSASFDGTCRIWRARDAGAPPIVLTIDPTRFGLSGHAATRCARQLAARPAGGLPHLWVVQSLVNLRCCPQALPNSLPNSLTLLASCSLSGLGWPSVAGPRSTAADAGGLGAGPGVRTTRNMERQLLGLLGGSGAAPSASQPQQEGARQSGRARQQRDLSEAAIAEDARRRWDAAEEEEGEEGEGADAAGEDGAAGGNTGLLVCGFSRDGTHIVAGGNDCGVYVWQWELPPPASANQQQRHAASPLGIHVSRLASASTRAGVGRAYADAAAPAAPGAGPEAAGQAQDDSAACTQAAAEGTPEEVAADEAAPSAAAEQLLGTRQPADLPAADERQQHAQPLPAAQQDGQQGQAARQCAGAASVAAALAVDNTPWPVPREVCLLKGHRNDIILLQFSHAGDRAATGSKDGSVRVRRRANAGSRTLGGAQAVPWCCSCQALQRLSRRLHCAPAGLPHATRPPSHATPGSLLPGPLQVWRRPRRWRKRTQAWEQEVTFAVLPDAEAIKEARRRRRPPPAPSVDQIAWSADDQLCVGWLCCRDGLGREYRRIAVRQACASCSLLPALPVTCTAAFAWRLAPPLHLLQPPTFHHFPLHTGCVCPSQTLESACWPCQAARCCTT